MRSFKESTLGDGEHLTIGRIMIYSSRSSSHAFLRMSRQIYLTFRHRLNLGSEEVIVAIYIIGLFGPMVLSLMPTKLQSENLIVNLAHRLFPFFKQLNSSWATKHSIIIRNPCVSMKNMARNLAHCRNTSRTTWINRWTLRWRFICQVWCKPMG
jgi:hypothetical protein